MYPVWLYPKWNQISYQEWGQAFLWHSLVVALTLIVRALCKQQLVTENLEDCLDKEIERRETERRDRRRR